MAQDVEPGTDSGGLCTQWIGGGVLQEAANESCDVAPGATPPSKEAWEGSSQPLSHRGGPVGLPAPPAHPTCLDAA